MGTRRHVKVDDNSIVDLNAVVMVKRWKLDQAGQKEALNLFFDAAGAEVAYYTDDPKIIKMLWDYMEAVAEHWIPEESEEPNE